MAEESRAELEIDAVSVRFGGLAVLEDVSLRAGTGEVVGIIGPNGAGKTTLFNVVCGFVRPSSGTVRWRGRELRHQHPFDLAKLGIARTLQGVGLISGLTALENVMLGATPLARSGVFSSLVGIGRSVSDERDLTVRAVDALERLGVADYRHARPAQLPYPIQKKVAIARALVAEPSLVMMDEPASGLSASDIEELERLLRPLRLEMGVLIVEHNMDLVMATCDRIVVLDFGRVVAAGTPSEIRENPKVTAAYLGAPVES